MMQLSKNRVLITRDDLYAILWETPVSKFAAEHDVIEKEIRKACKEHSIPLPSPGYWSKLKFDKLVKVDTLEPSPHGNPSISLRTSAYTENLLGSRTPLLAQKVPKRLGDPCQEALNLKQDFDSREEPKYKSVERMIYSQKGMFDVGVSKSNTERTIRFMDAFVKLANLLGYPVRISGPTEICVEGQWIKVRVRERSKRVQVEGFNLPTTELKLTGILAFEVDRYFEKSWKDGKVQSLEDSFSKIMPWLQQRASELTEEDERIEKMHEKMRTAREKRDQERLLIEQQRSVFRKLVEVGEKLRLARQIRSTIQEVEKRGQLPLSFCESQLSDWLLWARAKADWCDPFVDYEDEILGEDDLLGYLSEKPKQLTNRRFEE